MQALYGRLSPLSIYFRFLGQSLRMRDRAPRKVLHRIRRNAFGREPELRVGAAPLSPEKPARQVLGGLTD